MIEKNNKNNIKKFKMDKINGSTNTEKVTEIIKRQDEIEIVLEYIIKVLQIDVKRKGKF